MAKRHQLALGADDLDRQLFFILPAYVAPLGHSCAKEYCAEHPAYSCGCPVCLAAIGCTLVWNADDYDPEEGIQDHWRKRIVSIRTARLAAPLIIQGYPGYDPGPANPPLKPSPGYPQSTKSTEDTLPAEPRSRSPE